MSTPNTGIPYVPENTTDPAAGLNLSLNVIDALLQTAPLNMNLTAPPVTPADGDLHIVAPSATGDWAGQDNNLARYVEEGAFWQFYVAGVNVFLVLNKADGGLYAWNGSAWVPPVVAGALPAADVSYDNTTSGLTADDVQAALDELAGMTGGIVGPGTSTDNAVPRFDGVGGDTLQDSGVIVTDSDEISGYRGSINKQTGTTYTLVAGDTGKIVELTNAAAITLTLPNSLPQGFCCTVVQGGSGSVSFSPASGATLQNRNSHTATAGSWAMTSLYVSENAGSAAVYALGGDTA